MEMNYKIKQTHCIYQLWIVNVKVYANLQHVNSDKCHFKLYLISLKLLTYVLVILYFLSYFVIAHEIRPLMCHETL